MAYTDQRIGKNQRAVAMGVVALVQGAAIVALINGLAFRYINPPPPERLAGEQMPLTPPPKPIEPKPLPSQMPPIDYHRPPPTSPLDLGHGSGPVIDPYPQYPLDPPPTPAQDPVDSRPKPPSASPMGLKPRNAPGSWATASDYPARDLREGNQGVTQFSLIIGADGRVQSCAVIVSSGFPGLDKATCDNVARRARFEPATDGNGNRVGGTYGGRIRWEIPQD